MALITTCFFQVYFTGMICNRKALKIIFLTTFGFAVVTILSNIEYVILLPSKLAPRIVTLKEQEQKLILTNKSFDTGACAVPVTLMNDSHMTDSQGCKVPNLDPYNDYVMEALNPVSSIKCPGRLYTEYENNLFRLLDDVNEGLWTVCCFLLHEE